VYWMIVADFRLYNNFLRKKVLKERRIK